MIEKDRKIYLQLVNYLVGLEFRLECWTSVVQAAASSGDDVLDSLLDTLLVQLRGEVVHINHVRGFVVLRWCIACPQNQKSSGERSGLHGGQTWVILLEMTRPSNLVSNQFLTISTVCAVAPSCCHQRSWSATLRLTWGQTNGAYKRIH